ncbi:MAG: M28 family metallopeptidase [Candidatus Latescibacterota bacterium]|nr:M28 family metallopeptidase [Candidatus Latescibacterota bacterium]
MRDSNWDILDRRMVGEAWIGSRISEHLRQLCDVIGPRWSTSEPEWQAIEYLRDQFASAGVDSVEVENFAMESWSWSRADVELQSGPAFDVIPVIRCPTFQLQAPIVDVGFGSEHERAAAGDLRDFVAVMSLGFEPFTDPIPHAYRALELARAGASALVLVDPKDGKRCEYHSVHDLRDPDFPSPPLPAVTVSREDGARLRRHAGEDLHFDVVTELATGRTANVHATIRGAAWPEESLVLGGHHDTVYGAPGGNDNASGTIAVLETARVIAACGQRPGRTLHFVTFAAEEQGFLGSADFVHRHYRDPGQRPRLAINLDELSTGRMKGVVLAFPHLRRLVQSQLDEMGDGLVCHLMSQLDASSDHFPFLREGLDAAHLWRWRFHGRHSESDFHHEPADTAEKLNIRELKDYTAQLSRLLMRLASLDPEQWPQRQVSAEDARARIESERGTVIRVR